MDETDAAGSDNWYSNETATFGDRLVDARQAVGMSQEDLARRVGVKIKTLAAWENDLSEPRAARLNILSGLLNVSLRWLMTGEGDGLEAPGETGAMPGDTRRILIEMRQAQSDLMRLADRIGRLEKQLRATLKDGV